MIFYLYGQDSYRRQAKLRELVEAYRKKYTDIDLGEFDFSEREDLWKDAKNYLIQPSMFVESKVAVIFGGGQVNEKEWIEILKSQIKTTKTFLLVSDSVAPKKALQFLLKSPIKNHEYAPLDGRALEVFIKKEAEKTGIVFAPDAVRFFCRFAERHKEDASWVVFENLAKLALTKPQEPVKASALVGIIEEKEAEQVYLLTRSILSDRDKKTKLISLERLLLQNEAPAYIFNSLSFQSKGKEAFMLADYDILVKSGKLEYDEALLDFVLL